MLNWREITEEFVRAEIGNFDYTIESVDGGFHFSLKVCGEFIFTDGPYSLEIAKSKAEADYAARIAHAGKIIENGKYTEPYKTG